MTMIQVLVLIYDACMFVCTKQENSTVLNGDVDRWPKQLKFMCPWWYQMQHVIFFNAVYSSAVCFVHSSYTADKVHVWAPISPALCTLW